MSKGIRWLALLSAVAVVGLGALVPTAGAAITPAISLDQSAGTAAGSTANLGVDLTFAPTGTDSPDHMTLNLPPGLLANASIDGGACLTTADLDDTRVPGGQRIVDRRRLRHGADPHRVTFDLVPPPRRATSPASPSTATGPRSAPPPTSGSARRATPTGSA